MEAEDVIRQYLRPYQRAWVEDLSHRKICLKARRIGMSEAVLLDAILDALRHPGRDVYLTSTSYTDAKELLERLTRWFPVFGRVGYPLPIAEQLKTKVTFQNGSRIIPIPAARVRGRGGTIIMDELGFWSHARQRWADIAPAADTDPTMRIIVVSTPFGASGLYHELWTDPDQEHGAWSRHEIDIYQAAAQGFPVDPEQLREKYPRDVWAQEFCCEFLDDQDQYFSFDTIRRAQYAAEDAPTWAHPSPGMDAPPELYAGIDVASTQHASVLASLAAKKVSRERVARHRAMAAYLWPPHYLKEAGVERRLKAQRLEALKQMRLHEYWGLSVDAAGEGAQMGQDLAAELACPVKRIKGSDWSRVYALLPKLREGMEEGRVRIPYHPGMRNAFAKIKRTSTSKGRVKYEARQDGEGHADEFYASLLAYDAMLRGQRRDLAPPPRGARNGRSLTLKF